jgi:tetratricopeptide (TPR) repeat protein
VADFFISYNHKDSEWAEWIAWQLEATGYTTIVQAWDFGAGQNFVLAMQKAAVEAERTIAVLSPDYLTSRFTAPEWAAAFARDPTGEIGILVPIRVRECNLEGLLPQIVYIDLVDIQSPVEAADVLVQKVKRGRRKPETEPLFPGSDSSSAAARPFPGTTTQPLSSPRLSLPRDPNFRFVNVPPIPDHFVGREALLEDMIRRLNGGENAALSASGKGGVGKTTVAVAIAHSQAIYQHFTDGVLWAGLGPKPDVMSALASWGDALKTDVTGYVDADQRAWAIRNAIGLRRFLLVVDDAWQKEAALALRCGGPNCRHLLTTRDDTIARAFAGATGTERVPELEETPAFELLQQLAPEACATNPDAARRLARDVGGLPLVLELLGGYLGTPEHSLFPELIASAFTELTDPRRRLELAQRRLASRETQEITLRDVISLSLEGLPERAIHAFYALGSFAPKPESFSRKAAEAVTGADAATLAQLWSRNLLEYENGNFAVHQTIGDVAREHMDREAQRRHATHYLDRTWEASYDWKSTEGDYGQITWAFDKIDSSEQVFQYIWGFATYQRLKGLWRDALEWIYRGTCIAEEQDDTATLAVLLNNTGYAYYNLGEFKKALAHYMRALPLIRKVEDRASEAANLNNMGLVYDSLERYTKALECYERALPITCEIGDRRAEATTLGNIGTVYDALHKPERALRHHRRALPIHQKLGDREGEAGRHSAGC